MNGRTRHESLRLSAAVLAAGIIAVFSAASLAEAGPRGQSFKRRGDLKVREGGFRTELFEQCKWNGPRPRFPRRTGLASVPPRLMDIECGSGSFGERLYLSYTEGWHLGESRIVISRMDVTGAVGAWTGVAAFHHRSTDISFAPPSWREGEELFVTDRYTNGSNYSFIWGVAPDRSRSGQAVSPPLSLMGPSAADPTGAFGGDFFYMSGSSLMRQEADGTNSVFAAIGGGGDMRFGPGGAWGDDLYLSGFVVEPDGTVTRFPAGFGDFDWAFGSRFDGDMFAADYGEERILRITPDGATSVFATGAAGPIAFCDGSLWLGSPDGCVKITPRN